MCSNFHGSYFCVLVVGRETFLLYGTHTCSHNNMQEVVVKETCCHGNQMYLSMTEWQMFDHTSNVARLCLQDCDACLRDCDACLQDCDVCL